jgi:antitoxin component of RelBE/YafQ-DinJ toxin-antitoxin module
MAETQTTLTIRIDADLKKAAEIAAKDRDETISQAVRNFLRDYVKKSAQGDLLKPRKGD